MNPYEKGFKAGILPPSSLTVSEWSSANRVLNSKSSSEPGRYKVSRTPYLQEPMDLLSVTNTEIQKIINSYPVKWTKRDFRGEGKYNSQKILTRKETERPDLKFGHTGNSKHLEEVYKHSTSESIYEFKKGLIKENQNVFQHFKFLLNVLRSLKRYHQYC